MLDLYKNSRGYFRVIYEHSYNRKKYGCANFLVSSLKDALMFANKKNLNGDVFFSLATRSSSFSESHVKPDNFLSFPVVVLDCDNGLPDFENKPDYLFESSPNRYHAYFKVDGTKESYLDMCKKLKNKYKTDNTCSLSKFFRIPGSYSHKNRNFIKEVEWQ